MIGKPEGEIHPFRLLLLKEKPICTKKDPELFFPDPSNRPQIEAAKKVCNDYCRIRTECLMYALETDDQWAVMGGMDVPERNRLKRQERKVAA